MKKLRFKLILFILFIMLMTPILVLGIYEDNSLANKTYTRKEMQEMLVSTALSLYYNNYFSDYGQRAMDSLGVDNNYYKYGNILWRDLNISPEEVGFSKYYHIDCSGYNFLIYKNTLGYDMSEHYDVNRYLLFYQDKNYPLSRVSFYSGENRLYYYREAYERFGYGWNSGFLSNVSRKISGNCSDKNCTSGKESSEVFIYNNLDNKKSNELVYYFESNGYRTLEEVNEYYQEAEKKLQPGDIISYVVNKPDEEGNDNTSGHVMFYVGDDIMTSSKKESGFTDVLLHSTGNGGGDYTSFENSKNNKLRKETSIVKSSASNYIDGENGRFASTYENDGDYVVQFAIFRPLNTFCTSDNNCKISNNKNNVELSEVKLKNNEARVVLKKNQIQQYMYIEKEYSNTLDPISETKDGYTRNVIGEYNSINIGDSVVLKLRIRNKFDNTQTTGLKIEAIIPSNSTYVKDSCTNNCRKEGNKLIWDNISISGENAKVDITFKITASKEGTIEFNGYKIITSKTSTFESKELQMSNLNINVEPTQNGINKEILRSEVIKFQTLVEKGQITYSSNGSHSENMKDLDELLKNSNNKATVSNFGYVKMMYYNAFGLDLDALTGTNYILNRDKIINAVFTSVPYPERNNLKKKENGEYPLYSGDKSINIYARKLEDDTKKLTGADALIAKMVVPGLYGGRHLKGNDLGDRTKFLRSFVNNQAYQSDLEVGDIIFSFSNNSKSMTVYLYLGDDEKGPILTRFTSSNNQSLFLYHTDKYLDTYYKKDSTLKDDLSNKPSNQILNELFSKDLFVVLRPSRIGTTVEYDYNGGIEGTKSYVAYNKYNNLVRPRKNSTTKKLYVNNSNSNNLDSEHIQTTNFICWTTDSILNNCINNNSNLYKNNNKLYAKWSTHTMTLPKLTASGYKHLGWNTKANGSGTFYQINSNITVDKNTNLYAQWIKNSDLVIKNYKLDENNYYLSYIPEKTNLSTYSKNIILGDTYKLTVDLNNNYIYTGSKTRITKDNNVIVEYTNIVRGDVNGDGLVNIADVVKVADHTIIQNTIKNSYEKYAGEVTNDNIINISDVIKIADYTLNKDIDL